MRTKAAFPLSNFMSMYEAEANIQYYYIKIK